MISPLGRVPKKYLQNFFQTVRGESLRKKNYNVKKKQKIQWPYDMLHEIFYAWTFAKIYYLCRGGLSFETKLFLKNVYK